MEKKSWLHLSTKAGASAATNLTIPVGRKAGFVCLAAFCDWDANETPPPVEDATEKVGQHLADVVLVYDDGSEHTHRIRRRFEVSAPSYEWGHLAYAALPHRPDAPRKLTDVLPDGTGWGELQTAVFDNSYAGGPLGTLWVSALANPQSERTIKSIRIQAAGEDPLVVCGLTTFSGRENPLRYERLNLYRITLPEATAEEKDRWKVEVDLGVVARQYVLPEFDSAAWLASPSKGLGGRNKPVKGARHLYAEVTASSEATLRLIDSKAPPPPYEFDLGQVVPGKELEARHGSARVEILEKEKTWLHGQVLDAGTGKPTPVRLAFRSKDGRYIPPYGHRTEINDGWFQDYGADVKLMDTSFAYVDGTFQVELPVGDVYVEMTKGFEFEPVRQKLSIEPGQRELKLADRPAHRFALQGLGHRRYAHAFPLAFDGRSGRAGRRGEPRQSARRAVGGPVHERGRSLVRPAGFEGRRDARGGEHREPSAPARPPGIGRRSRRSGLPHVGERAQRKLPR